VSPAEFGAVVVWRRAGALLAAELDAVAEVAAVAGDGVVHARDGDLELTALPGLGDGGAALAVVLQPVGGAGGRRLALPADTVEGVVAPGELTAEAYPAWMRGLPMPHVRGLLRMDGGRLAALLYADALGDG
jgi:hypothetical protein